jgi:hypothetical protein
MLNFGSSELSILGCEFGYSFKFIGFSIWG